MRGQASSVMTASHLFRANEPFLLIANIIYEQELLERLVKFEMPSEDSTSMITLVDDASEMVFWAMADHCAEFCRHGHCNVLVKVLLGDEKGQRGQTRDSVEERDLVPGNPFLPYVAPHFSHISPFILVFLKVFFVFAHPPIPPICRTPLFAYLTF